MRVIALAAAHNEARFMAGCIEHLNRHGVEVYLIDNDSTDDTVAIARRYLNHGVAGIERLPRDGTWRLKEGLRRKEQVAATLAADWFMHIDVDEIRLPPRQAQTLAEAFEEADEQGYNALDFQEFTFTPTREAPDHDHPAYLATMRSYYAFLPWSPHRLTAWKRRDEPVDLAWSAGHQVRFPGLKISPTKFRMRHYLFLSVEHAVRKYVHMVYDSDEIKAGVHLKRAALRREDIRLPCESELLTYDSDDTLDDASPRFEHFLFKDVRPLVGSPYGVNDR